MGVRLKHSFCLNSAFGRSLAWKLLCKPKVHCFLLIEVLDVGLEVILSMDDVHGVSNDCSSEDF